MFYLVKKIEISAAHRLSLNYESKCSNTHGHNWDITVHLKSQTLDENGMIMDFSKIKKLIKEPLDHKVLNDIFDFNPTAENIAKWVCDTLGEKCYKVEVTESRDNTAIYARDE